MVNIYKFEVNPKGCRDREDRLYDYFQTYMDNLECLCECKSIADVHNAIGKFVLGWLPYQTDDIVGIMIEDEDGNFLDFLYETSLGTLCWSPDHVDVMEKIERMY